MGVILAIAFIVLFYVLTPPEGLSAAGMKTIGLMLAFLVMLISEALPLVLTCLITLGLLPTLGIVGSFSGALSGFSNQVVFFVLASFGIAMAFERVPLSKRILVALLRKFGKNVKSMLLAMMVCTALISSLVSNVPTCAIFMAISLNFLDLYDNEEEKRRTGKMFMIAIPVASMIGGMMTPAGSSINILTISLLEQYTGLTITFVQWMLAGIPLVIVTVPIAWFIMLKVYKPAEISEDMVKRFIDEIAVSPKMGNDEKKLVVLTAVMLILWIMSSWVSGLNVMVIALFGCCVLFLPGVEILELSVFLKENSWDSFFLVGTVLGIGGAMVSNGVSAWVVNIMPTLNVSLMGLIAIVAILIFVLLIVIPVAPSLLTVITPLIISLATNAGVSPVLLMLCMGLAAANCYLLPLDTVTLITYGKGYYSMLDMPKSTIFIQILLVILISVWLPIAGHIAGII